MIEVAVLLVRDDDPTPLNETPSAPVRFVPVIVTDVPTGPLAGVNVTTFGSLSSIVSVVVPGSLTVAPLVGLLNASLRVSDGSDRVSSTIGIK